MQFNQMALLDASMERGAQSLSHAPWRSEIMGGSIRSASTRPPKRSFPNGEAMPQSIEFARGCVSRAQLAENPRA
jgi:hypothetical protein